LAELREQVEQRASIERVIDDALARVSKLPRRERLLRLGEVIAQAAGADHWLLAIANGAALQVEAASGGIDANFPLDDQSALANCYRRASTIVSSDARDYRERKFLRPQWICAPFAAGAVALGGIPRPLGEGLPPLESLLSRLSPLVSIWLIEQQGDERRALVQQLAVRLFAAVDQERARIARDLHDDQAQLLAAARIALEGRRDEARGILHQLEQELRRRTRELRPPTLGRLSLGEALAGEVARMREAGVTARISLAADSEMIARPIQELCFKVAREAFSNVIRHARASAVSVTLERDQRITRITIADNGAGIDAANRSDGTGLAGLSERLELMGGSLVFDSRPGATRVVAEIPEF
ncbi:MAG: sensor histidine kinase, partial [Candidatus Binataceae bacterium]